MFRFPSWLSGAIAMRRVLYSSQVAALLQISDGTTQEIPSRPTCRECRVLHQLHLRLGDSASGDVGLVHSVVRDNRGRFYAVSQSRPFEVLFFDSAGQFVRALGRDGSGPGEFRWAGGISILPGDSLLVIDPRLRRLTVLTPEQRVARALPMPAGSYKWEETLLDDGGLVLNMHVGSPELAGALLHLLDQSGTVIRSFGAADGEVVRADLRASTDRRLARARGRGLWAARVNQYKVELWNHGGQRVRELTGSRSWFKPWWVETDLGTDVPPQPRLLSIHEDRVGLLWIMFRVPNPQWQRGLERIRTPEGTYFAPREDDLVFDTIIEILDSRGSLLVSDRLPVALVRFVDDGLAFSLGSPSGEPQILVWNLSLLKPR